MNIQRENFKSNYLVSLYPSDRSTEPTGAASRAFAKCKSYIGNYEMARSSDDHRWKHCERWTPFGKRRLRMSIDSHCVTQYQHSIFNKKRKEKQVIFNWIDYSIKKAVRRWKANAGLRKTFARACEHSWVSGGRLAGRNWRRAALMRLDRKLSCLFTTESDRFNWFKPALLALIRRSSLNSYGSGRRRSYWLSFACRADGHSA